MKKNQRIDTDTPSAADAVDNDSESSELDGERTDTDPNAHLPVPDARGRIPGRRRGAALPHELPEALKELTIRSLRKLDKVIKLPIDEDNGALLRSIVTSCGIAISSQLRADEQQLRAKAHGDALQRLLKIIEKERALLEDKRSKCSCGRPYDQCDPNCGSVPVSSENTDSTDLQGPIERLKVPGDSE